MSKLVAALICLVLGVLILAKFYGLNPNELTPEVLRDLFVRAFYDLRDAIYGLVEKLQSVGRDLLNHGKETSK